MYKNFFEGWYFKHQNKKDTLSFIPGVSDEKAFIQVITDKNSYNVDFDKQIFHKGKVIKIDKNTFSCNGISINIEEPNLKVEGKIQYSNLTPLRTDIMGFFRHFPMQCRHGIISVHHNLKGYVNVNDEHFDFSNGIGYIEKDSGCSFPRRYAWIQSNHFNQKCSIMIAVADIPFFGFNFEGIICTIYYKGEEYRLATYNGTKIIKCNKDNIVISNRNSRVEVYIGEYSGHKLYAPVNGKMSNIIKEAPSCNARFKFYKDNELMFDLESLKTRCEFIGY